MLTGLSAGDILAVLVSIVIGLSIHEAMHAYVAHWLGDDTAHHEGRLTLNPLAHIDLFTTVLLPVLLILIGGIPIFAARPVPIDPYKLRWGEYGGALVGVAGPLTNLALACLAALILRAWGGNFSSIIYHNIVIFTEVNVAFFVFNMIPFPPLDGSRLLYAFAPEWLQEIMRQIEGMGFLFVLLFFVLAFQFIIGPLAAIEQAILNFLLV